VYRSKIINNNKTESNGTAMQKCRESMAALPLDGTAMYLE